jgi:hypothetical protein
MFNSNTDTDEVIISGNEAADDLELRLLEASELLLVAGGEAIVQDPVDKI